MTTLLIFAVCLLFLAVLDVVLTYAATKILKTENQTWRMAVGATAVVWCLSIGVAAAAFTFRNRGLGGEFGNELLGGISLGLALLVYKYSFHTTGNQLIGFLVKQCGLGVAAILLALSLRWFVLEAFVIPTNAMAPNVCGHRKEGKCPECGGLTIMTADDEQPQWDAHRPPMSGTCTRCSKDWDETYFDGSILRGDRIAAGKWYEPERWDAIVFRYPEDPKINYIKRVVGMPGEEVVIGDDGFLIVDGKRIEPPAEFAALRYHSKFPFEASTRASDGGELWGTSHRPMKLGPEEYFVLGDHTYRSLDARFWGPVKREAIIGTATLIYWPPERWRIFK